MDSEVTRLRSALIRIEQTLESEALSANARMIVNGILHAALTPKVDLPGHAWLNGVFVLSERYPPRCSRCGKREEEHHGTERGCFAPLAPPPSGTAGDTAGEPCGACGHPKKLHTWATAESDDGKLDACNAIHDIHKDEICKCLMYRPAPPLCATCGKPVGFRCRDHFVADLAEARRERDELHALVNTPEVIDFVVAHNERMFQVTRRERAEALHNALGLSEYDGYRDRVNAIDRALEAVERDTLERAARVADQDAVFHESAKQPREAFTASVLAFKIRALAEETL